ncbi:MAG: hypothetical protein F4093_04200, partial [Gammaproteobacteria bacterium]|nr:hypothetical protein [Gammaproteobacteria bacterium]
MRKPGDATDPLVSKACDDPDFRERLLARPRETIEEEFGVSLAEDHRIVVHEETYAETHVVLPPRSKLSEAEQQEAKAGVASLEFLRRTLHDPAPPIRPPGRQRAGIPNVAATARD